MYHGEYFLYSKISHNKVLDVSQNSSNFGNLVLYDYNGQNNQIFKISKATESNSPFYVIQSKKSNKVLTVEAYSEDNGKNIIEEAYQNKDAQKFKIREINQGEIVLYTFCGKVVDIEGFSTKNDTRIIQWPYNGGNNQIWVLRPV